MGRGTKKDVDFKIICKNYIIELYIKWDLNVCIVMRDRVSYWSHWCEDCANLRRLLLIYEPKKCIDILKRTLTSDDSQITYKIHQKIKKIVNKYIETNVKLLIALCSDDHTYETRSKKKIVLNVLISHSFFHLRFINM